MSAQALQKQDLPDFNAIEQWASNTHFNLQQIDCLIGIMLKILDGKCKMDEVTQHSVQIIYRQAHHQQSHLFDPAIHLLIKQSFEDMDRLMAKQVHHLRLFAESAIPKPVMKGFKQYLWANMP